MKTIKIERTEINVDEAAKLTKDQFYKMFKGKIADLDDAYNKVHPKKKDVSEEKKEDKK